MKIREFYESELLRRQTLEQQKYEAAKRLFIHTEAVLNALRVCLVKLQDRMLDFGATSVCDEHRHDAKELLLLIKSALGEQPPCGGCDDAIRETGGDVSRILVNETGALYRQMLDDAFNSIEECC